MEQFISVFLDYISVTFDAYYNDVTDKIVAFPLLMRGVWQTMGLSVLQE